jgi:apolipoprotein N-acyltransferase
MVAAWLIGAIAWRGPLPLLALSILLPWLVFRQETRKKAACAAGGYFLAASIPIIEVWKTFSPDQPAQGVLIWAIASAILTLPWALFWNANRSQQIWRIPAALAISILPPIGLIGWASPLAATGVLLPGTGFAGLAATSLAPVYPKLAATAILIANLTFHSPTDPSGIAAINTIEVPERYVKEESARTAIHSAKAEILILPEGAVHRWTEATEAFWAPTIQRLHQEQRTALIGAGIHIPGSTEFKNTAITIGEWQTKPFEQRIPIPLGMWKPFGPADGVQLNLTGPSTLQVGPHRLAILICYEQLLVWPILQSALEKPTLMVGISNATWTKQTKIPAAQEACLEAWSRLFGIPYLSAVNS